MARTRRRTYNGDVIRDGEHGKRCPESNCITCITGKAKRPFRRWFRHQRVGDD